MSVSLAFDEIIANGDSEELYGSLLSTIADQIELDTRPGVKSEFNQYIAMLSSSDADERQRATDALAGLIVDWKTQVNDRINADLAAQAAQQQVIENLNIAATLQPPAEIKQPKLLELIATDTFKEIFGM